MGNIQRGMYGSRARESTPTFKSPEGESHTNTDTHQQSNGNPYGFEPTTNCNTTTLGNKKEDDIKSEDPVIILLKGKRKWVCPKCDKVLGSRNGCDAHIRQTKTQEKPLYVPCAAFQHTTLTHCTGTKRNITNMVF